MRVTRIGWHYGDTVGSADRNNQSDAGEAVAWAYLNSDHEDVVVHIWLQVRADNGAGGVVPFDYPSAAGIRGLEYARASFSALLAQRVPMSMGEAREWFVSFVEPHLKDTALPTEFGRSFARLTERPAPPNPGEFMRGVMEHNHPLNAPAEMRQVSDEELVRRLVDSIDEYTDVHEREWDWDDQYDVDQEFLDELYRDNPNHPLNASEDGHSDIVDTPGSPDITEDIPPAPELPDDHPLKNRNDGFHINHMRSSLLPGQHGRWQHTYSAIAPPDTDGLGLLVGAHVFVGNEELPHGVVQSVEPLATGTYLINFTINVDYEHLPLGAHFRAVPRGTVGRPELWIQALTAEPQRYWIFKVTCLDPFLVSNVAVCPHPDNGHMVIGLFFVPPANDFCPDWHDRMCAWATWCWGREGADLVINAPDQTRSREPRDYIPSLLSSLLNRSLTGWNVVRAPQLPCWLPSGHRYEVS